jgi:hypothetical protein
MSEYSAPANEGLRDRLKRKLSAAGREMGLTAPEKGQPARISPEAVKKALLGVGEAGLSAATGAVATPVAGLAGLAEMPFRGVRKSAEDMRSIQQGLTYEPRTETGKAITELSNAPMEAAGKALGAAGGYVGEKIGKAMGGERGGIYGRAAGETVGELTPGVAATIAGGRSALKEAGKAALGEGRQPVEIKPESNIEALKVKAQEQGYVLPPSTANPSLANKALTGWGGKIANESEASLKNQVVTNQKAARAIGLPEGTELTDAAFEDRKAELSKPYQAVSQLGELNVTGVQLPKEVQVRKTRDPLAMSGKDVVMVDAGELVQQWKQFNSDARGFYRAYERDANPETLAKANAADKNAAHMDRLILKKAKESNVPGLYDALKEARKDYAILYSVEKATNMATGDVDAAKLAKSRYLTGELKDISDFAKGFPKLVKTPARVGTSPGISPLDVAAAGMEAAPLMAAGHPGAAAGVVGTVLGRPLGRALGLSEAYQKGPAAAARFDMGGKPFLQQTAPALAVGEEQAQEATKIPRIELNGMAQ